MSEADNAANPLQKWMVKGSRPMHAAARQVHEAVGNIPEQKLTHPQATPAKGSAPDGYTNCKMCLQHKPSKEGYSTGRGSKVFICNPCNALEGRIRRLTSGTQAQKMWKDMSPEDKQEWRLEHTELREAALREALSVTFTQKIIFTETTKSGQLGTYWPLSVYKNQGYDATWLKHIEQHAAKRTETDGLVTYALRVHFEGSEKRRAEIKESLWKPIEKPEKQPKKNNKKQKRDEHGDGGGDGQAEA